MVISNWKEIDLTGIKAVLMDLDDTIYQYEPVHQKSYEACVNLASTKYQIPAEEFKRLWKLSRDRVHHDLHNQGASHSRLLYLQKIYESYFGCTNAEFALELEACYWNTFLASMQFRNGVIEFVSQFKSLGLKAAIVTDLTAQIQLQKWQTLNLSKYFDFLVSSEEAGVEKPNPTIFKLALEKLKVEADDVIMIGDSKSKDYQGALDMGIRAYLVTDSIE